MDRNYDPELRIISLSLEIAGGGYSFQLERNTSIDRESPFEVDGNGYQGKVGFEIIAPIGSQ